MVLLHTTPEDQPKWVFTETATGGTFATEADGAHTLTHSDQIPGLTAAPHREPPASFSTTSLFIDDATTGGMVCRKSQSSLSPNYSLDSPAPIPAPTSPGISAVFYKDCTSKGGYALLV